MADTPQTRFNITNNLIQTTPNGVLIHFVEGKTTRGKINNPEEVIKSWPEFVKKFGGYRNDTTFPHLCKRMFDRGSYLRVNRLQHYNDITDNTSGTALKASLGYNSYKIAFSAATDIGQVFSVKINGVVKTYNIINTHTAFLSLMVSVLRTDFPQIISIIRATTPNGGFLTIVFGDNSAVNASNVTGSGAPTITLTNTSVSDRQIVSIDGDNLFNLIPKYEGSDMNNVSVGIEDASNGNPDYFNLVIKHSTDSYLNEVYTNLKIEGSPTVEQSHYLDIVKNNSILVDVVYNDLSSFDSPIRPKNWYLVFQDGYDGDSLEVTDYIGDSNSKLGLNAFDAYDDGYTISAPEMSDILIHQAGDVYVDQRKDLVYGGHFSNDLFTASALTTERNNTNIDNKLVFFTAGGGKIFNPESGLPIQSSELADALGCLSFTFQSFKPWYSPMGTTRGLVPNIQGVINNFGSNGSLADLNLLCNNGINMLIRRDNKVFMQNNITARRKEDAEQQLSVIMLELYLIKTLRPILNGFLDEPNDITTWRRMYYTVKPTFDDLVTKRGLYAYTWEGDQFVNDMTELQINNSADVSNGKYKIKATIEPIPGLREISLEIILTSAGASFNFNQ